MRITRTLLATTVLATIAVVAAPESDVHAQNFAGATWVPLTRATATITDADDGITDNIDVVGDASNPAAFVWSDATFLYFRIRVSAKPTNASNVFASDKWGCVIDTDHTLNTYEFYAAIDGTTANVIYQQNTTPTADSLADVAETGLDSSSDTARFRAVDAITTIGGSENYFADFVVPWVTIRTGAAGVPAGRSMRFICGTSSGTSNLAADAFAPGGTLTATWSDGFVCGDSGCVVDQDQDDVPDAVEDTAGITTNKTNPDTDNDGLRDNIELSVNGDGSGGFAAVDTDGDGVIDAKDSDADNDCTPDSKETANQFRNTSSPNFLPSAACKNPTPVCKIQGGQQSVCVGCDSSKLGGGSFPCPFTNSPSCQKTGALMGQCTECNATETDLCTTVKPACEATTGACSACNGDNGSTKSAACPSALKPICGLTGPLTGQCLECSVAKPDVCTGAKPACDSTTGSCATCNGDRNSGATKFCPKSDAPTCDLTAGTCGKCTTNSDCGGGTTGHTGPTCNTSTGECTDVDTDGDGLNDTIEGLLGTDPTHKDTDSDGLDDKTEVTPNGGGAFQKIDTDGDGMIDAHDTDADNDGVGDSDEKTDDVDTDGIPNFRDRDDDGDGIDTSVEVADTKRVAGLPSDVDGDGQPNWYDTDADGDGKPDSVEGRGDDDGDGIPNYLDNDKSFRPDAGTVDTDAGPEAGPPDAGGLAGDGVVEGTGLFCGRGIAGSSGAGAATFLLGVLSLAALRRRHRK